ncbi:MAG: FprA family A-type flavoprotein [Candidatus Izemoplasmatales bacterium]|jgi:flavorubredoxin|nr:FprA family A-type flavoprotein [Candidatus Izemoplasmatales bacterium]
MKSYKLKEGVYWVGTIDYDLKVFDIVMYTEFGSTYNSYIVKGSEKTALIDTAKLPFKDEFFERIEDIIKIEDIDYLIVNHAEPDHSGLVEFVLEKNPNIQIYGSPAAGLNIKEIVNKENINFNRVKDGERLSLGNRTLEFSLQPNLHWPDTMFTYLIEDNILFTCDFFGAHYAFDGVVSSNLKNIKDYDRSLKEYFDAIMSPFMSAVRRGINKVKEYYPEIIATSHGAVLEKDYIIKAVKLYEKRSKEVVNEVPLVVIPFASAYNYTKQMALIIEKAIKEEFNEKVNVELYDLIEAKVDNVVKRIKQSNGFLIGSATIVRDTLPTIWEILSKVHYEELKGKIATSFGSYGWSGEAVDNINQRLEQLKMKPLPGLKIKFRPSEKQEQEIYEFGKSFAQELRKII